MISRIARIFLPVIAVTVFLSGCVSSIFPEYNPAGRTIAGQMLYSSRKRTFIGEFTVRQSSTDFALDVTKGPGMQLILVRENGNNLARVEALEHAWQGNPQRFVPPQVRHWLAMREVFSGATPEGATVTRAPQQITVEFENGERFVFHING
jgi:hypothetical protein